MFLKGLGEEAGKKFIELAVIAMGVDGVCKQSEENLLTLYKSELGLNDYSVKGESVDILISFFKTCDETIKHIIITELAGVLYADQEFKKIEEDWLIDIAQKINVTEDFVKLAIEWIKKFVDGVFEGRKLIGI